MTKVAPGPNTIMTSTAPYQGLSIDFSFSGTTSDDASRTSKFLGFNGETSMVLITDHFSKKMIGSARKSKASPINWIKQILDEYGPKMTGKYVFMDQGGELYHNPAVQLLFTNYGYAIRPTGAGASHQNGVVERAHRTVANAVRAMLHGAGLGVAFWPYAFAHWIRIMNALPIDGHDKSPLEIADGIRDDFSNLRTFGATVYVQPPTRRQAKFVTNAQIGVFLGVLPGTTRNILWYDPATNKVKIATHVRFDEGMNHLPIDKIPPNVQQLHRAQYAKAFPAETM